MTISSKKLGLTTEEFQNLKPGTCYWYRSGHYRGAFGLSKKIRSYTESELESRYPAHFGTEKTICLFKPKIK